MAALPDLEIPEALHDPSPDKMRRSRWLPRRLGVRHSRSRHRHAEHRNHTAGPHHPGRLRRRQQLTVYSQQTASPVACRLSTRGAAAHDRRISRRTPGSFRTRVLTVGVEPTLRIEYKTIRIKEYFKLGRALRTETTFNDTHDFGVGRDLHNLDHLRRIGRNANRRLLAVETSMPASCAPGLARLDPPAPASPGDPLLSAWNKLERAIEDHVRHAKPGRLSRHCRLWTVDCRRSAYTKTRPVRYDYHGVGAASTRPRRRCGRPAAPSATPRWARAGRATAAGFPAGCSARRARSSRYRRS